MDNITTIYSETSFFDWLLANKEERKIIKFAKEMAKAINLDLKEIARNNECANLSLPQIGNTKLIIKGGHIEKWRVYFLSPHYACVAYPWIKGTTYISELFGGNISIKANDDNISRYYLKTFAINQYSFKANIEEEKTKLEIYSWLNNHVDESLNWVNGKLAKNGKLPKLKL